MITATFKECTKYSDSVEEKINFFWGSGGRVLHIQRVTKLAPVVSINSKIETKRTDIHVLKPRGMKQPSILWYGA